MKRMLLFLFMIGSPFLHAQPPAISGILRSSTGQVVPFASVMIKDANELVVGFKSSEVNGVFSITLPPALKVNELHLEINHLGFKKIRSPLEEGRSYYEILMEERSINLADVEVKSRPRITGSGDTLHYDVEAFAKNEDRSIGDVLKRMPGMEVSENGQVKFNGQNISNLYIDGDDLLDDKYAIGTKTIPYAMVKGIEVMQNHQPIKVLKNKVLSDKIALNLVIKEEAKLKLSGQVKLGAGLPQQFDSELNTVLFNKKYKVLNVLKGNNVGGDLASDFTGFNLEAKLSEVENFRPSALLSLGTAGPPKLSKGQYFFNHSGALNAHNLMNLRNGLQLKSRVGLLMDRNDMHYTSSSAYYSNGDTIRYKEEQGIDNRPFITDIAFSVNLNKDHYYFNNSLNFTYSAETSKASLLTNAATIQQQLTKQVRDFSNTLAYVPELKNGNIISIDWYVNHYQQPQMLRIHPGINADLFNQGDAFEGIDQRIESPTWFNAASVGYRLTKGKVKHGYQLGIVNEFQELHSYFRLKQLDGSLKDYPGSVDNQLHWNRNKVFARSEYEYKKGKLQSVLSIPLALQAIGYSDKGFDLKERKNKVLLSPSFRLKYLVGHEDYLTLKYSYQNQTGKMTSIYRGAILTNYRSVLANDAVLNEQNSHTVGMQYNFRRSIDMVFMHAGMSYNRASSNTIASNVVSGLISQTVLLTMANHVNSIQANAGISKFIYALGATADLNASWSSTRFNQLFNAESLPFNNVSLMLRSSIEVRLWRRIAMRYNGNVSWVTSKLIRKESHLKLPDQQVVNLEQSVDLSYSPAKSLFLRMSGRHHYSKQTQSQAINYFFLDASTRYRIKHLRTDIEVDISNLADIKRYQSYRLTANQFLHNQYQLRGRTLLLKLIFNL